MAVIEYDEYKQKLQALEPTLQEPVSYTHLTLPTIA